MPLALSASKIANLIRNCPSPRNCTRVPYHESRKNLLHAVLVFLRPRRLRSLITAISCQVDLRKKICKVREVCERIFTCSCLVNNGLAMLRQAERTRQPALGSDFQMRPTIEQAYWSRDFETAKAQKACTKQGQGIATRVTKSGAGVDAD